MIRTAIKSLAVGAAAFMSVSAANAVTYVYVGSWSPYSAAAPTWYGTPPNGPLAYTGQEAAAFLFGGSAANYAISTVGPSVSTIDHLANYDVIGYGHAVFADNYSSKYLGQFYGPTSGFTGAMSGAASALIRDNFVTDVNYAFAISGAVPEPATWMMMILGFGAVGGAMRYRQRKSAVTFA